MRKIGSYGSLEKFGRIRLSKNFFMRDFLYSEISNFYGIQEGMCPFNLSWHEVPKKTIRSWMNPRVLLKGGHGIHGFADWYKDFPTLVVG